VGKYDGQAFVRLADISPVLGAPADPGFAFTPTLPAHGWLVTLALVSQVAGWLLIATALPRLPAVETSVLCSSSPSLR
jgi:drug/metabolite transporter (DMT)-like permease